MNTYLLKKPNNAINITMFNGQFSGIKHEQRTILDHCYFVSVTHTSHVVITINLNSKNGKNDENSDTIRHTEKHECMQGVIYRSDI